MRGRYNLFQGSGSSTMIGTTLSHYRITEKLGEGGMGVVYKAVDTKLERPVALKFLSASALEDEDATARFFREAKAAAALDHENICTIHEIDEVDGHTFMAMAFIEGRTIKQMVLERPLPIDQALDIAIQTAGGLQVAHEKGIVHRDIKSSNLMLTPRGQVKILDFGLAQLAEGSKLTKTQTILGTPAYMSPEQVRGENTDRRTDIWSLGVVLYEMVTGKRPFAGEAEAALTYGILNKEPEPVTGLRSGMPLDLDRILSKALAKDPDERYQHVDEFMVDLRGLRGKRTGAERVERRKESPNRERPRAVRRRVLQLKAAIGAAIVLSFLLVGWLFTKSDRQAATLDGQGAGESSPSLAVLPLENLSGDPEQEYFTDGLTEELISNLGTIRSLRVVSRTSAMQYKGTKKLLPEIARELNVNHLIEGSALRADDQIRVTVRLTEAAADRQVWSHSYERPLRDIISLQREIAREVARAIELEMSPDEEARLSGGLPVDPAAYTEYLKGRMYLAQRHPESFRRAEQYFQRAIESNPRYARAYAGLADTYLLMMWYSIIHPRKGYPMAERMALKALEIDDSLAEAHVSLAFARFFDWEASEASFRRALELNPGYADGRHWYAGHLNAAGRHEQAIEQMQRALDLDPYSLIFNTDLGLALYYARRPARAAEQLRRTLGMDPLFFRAHSTLGEVYTAQGQYDEAISVTRQSVELSGRNPQALAALGHAYGKSGERRKALDLLEELKERSKDEHVSSVWLAYIHVGLGNTDEAMEALTKAWYDREPWVAFVNVWPALDPFRYPKTARQILKKIQRNERDRRDLAGIKKLARERTRKANIHNKKLRDCKVHFNEPREKGFQRTQLFITEGDSASGSLTKVRQVQTQAVFSLRGKPLNCFGLSRKVVYQNEELNLLQHALGIEDGIENLRYNQVVLATDADVDGMHIRLLLLTFFLQFFPELVRKGHLYILQTPLFRVRNSKMTLYCYDEKAKRDAILGMGGKPEITRFKGLGEISPNEFKNFLGENIRLDRIHLPHGLKLKDHLRFYMGANTPDRKKFILNNLVTEPMVTAVAADEGLSS